MLIPFGVASNRSNWEVNMSTSLLYHAFSVRGYEHVRTEYQGGVVIFNIRQASSKRWAKPYQGHGHPLQTS
jgi:hypothetical protein